MGSCLVDDRQATLTATPRQGLDAPAAVDRRRRHPGRGIWPHPLPRREWKVMTSKQPQLRIQQLKIRTWFHIAASVIYVSGALFCAVHQIIIGALLFVAFAAVSVRIVVKSGAELSRLKDHESYVGHGASNYNMTLDQSEARTQKLRIRAWLSIVAAAIFTSIALVFATKQDPVVALPFIVLAAISARTIVKSAEELSRLKDQESEID
jgi:hypothetical protein